MGQARYACWIWHAGQQFGIISGTPPVPIRWVLIRDPLGQVEAQALLSTDVKATAEQIVTWFVQRWQIEVTLQEGRAHLDLESQRQWSDFAVPRTGSSV